MDQHVRDGLEELFVRVARDDWDLAEEKASPAGNSSDKTRSTSHNLSRDELFDRGQGAEVDWIDTSSEWW
jgi:hypothetical protein